MAQPGEDHLTKSLGGSTPLNQLLIRARDGDMDAFEALVRSHSGPVYRVALRMLGDTSDAEDVTQDVFLQAWRSLDQFRGDSALSTWLYRVVTNRCLNRLNRSRRTDPMPDTVLSPAPGPARTVEARSQVADLGRVIQGLSPEQRAVLVLREIEGCSYEQIAEILGVGLPAVKSRLHRARLSVLTAMRGWS